MSRTQPMTHGARGQRSGDGGVCLELCLPSSDSMAQLVVRLLDVFAATEPALRRTLCPAQPCLKGAPVSQPRPATGNPSVDG